MVREKRGEVDDPLLHVINILRRANTITSKKLSEFRSNDMLNMQHVLRIVFECISICAGSRYMVYSNINPTCTVHRVYCIVPATH